MSPDRHIGGWWVHRRRERGALSITPFKIVGETDNPGLVAECLNGETYVVENGGLFPLSRRKAREVREVILLHQKQEDLSMLEALDRLAKNGFPSIAMAMVRGFMICNDTP